LARVDSAPVGVPDQEKDLRQQEEKVLGLSGEDMVDLGVGTIGLCVDVRLG
jgi:hypothetical protein